MGRQQPGCGPGGSQGLADPAGAARSLTGGGTGRAGRQQAWWTLDLPALLGGPGSRGRARLPDGGQASPNACHPSRAHGRGNGSLGAIVLIRRYDCTFDLKVLHAQPAGTQALLCTMCAPTTWCAWPTCMRTCGSRSPPSVFVGEAASQDLQVIMRCDKSAHVVLLPDYPPHPDLDCHPVLAISWVLGRALALLTSAVFVLQHLWRWLWSWRASGQAVQATHPEGPGPHLHPM